MVPKAASEPLPCSPYLPSAFLPHALFKALLTASSGSLPWRPSTVATPCPLYLVLYILVPPLNLQFLNSALVHRKYSTFTNKRENGSLEKGGYLKQAAAGHTVSTGICPTVPCPGSHLMFLLWDPASL